MRMRALAGAAIAAPLLMIVSGCATDEAPSAAGAARRFFAAIGSGQGQAACALLTPETAGRLNKTQAGGCPKAVLGFGLAGGPVREVEVWGRSAQVRMERDTLFLHRFPSGWLIDGAGCQPRGDRPYECTVKA